MVAPTQNNKGKKKVKMVSFKEINAKKNDVIMLDYHNNNITNAA